MTTIQVATPAGETMEVSADVVEGLRGDLRGSILTQATRATTRREPFGTR